LFLRIGFVIFFSMIVIGNALKIYLVKFWALDK